MSATRFFNQISGLCDAYTAQINRGENLTQEQELIFDKISLVLGEIKSKFNLQTESMVDGSFNFIDASIFNDEGLNELSVGMGNLTSSAIEYPSMIFDGPFSTALEIKEVKGLSEKEINQKENPIEFAEKVQEIVPKIIEKEEKPKVEFSLNEDDLYEINELINTVPDADTLVVLVNGVEIYSKINK